MRISHLADEPHLPIGLLSLSLLGAMFLGCVGATGDGSGSGPTPGADAAADAPVASDAGGGADTGGGGCPARPDLETASPACNTVVNGAGSVGFTAGVGTPRPATGGALVAGLYESTRVEGWGNVPPSGRRLTLVISGQPSRILWAGDVLDATGAVTRTLRASSTAVVSGNQIALTTDCASSDPSPIPDAVSFTASGANLELSIGSGNDVFTTRYTRRGCAP